MKYEYLTRMINLIATTESEGRRVRLNFYHQYEGAYTVLFLTDFSFTLKSADSSQPNFLSKN